MHNNDKYRALRRAAQALITLDREYELDEEYSGDVGFDVLEAAHRLLDEAERMEREGLA